MPNDPLPVDRDPMPVRRSADSPGRGRQIGPNAGSLAPGDSRPEPRSSYSAVVGINQTAMGGAFEPEDVVAESRPRVRKEYANYKTASRDSLPQMHSSRVNSLSSLPAPIGMTQEEIEAPARGDRSVSRGRDGLDAGEAEQSQLPMHLQGIQGENASSPSRSGLVAAVQTSIPTPSSMSDTGSLHPDEPRLSKILSPKILSAGTGISPLSTDAKERVGLILPPGLDAPADAGDQDADDQVAPLSVAAEHRRKRKEMRASKARPGAAFYMSSPGALSTADRDATLHQGRFDMGSLYQTQLRNDRYCLIVDFSNGRIQFSNELCDSLFESSSPLPQRDITDFIHEPDRAGFSASIMYLSLGKYTIMDPQELHVNTTGGVRRALVSGEQLVGCWWWLDFDFQAGVETSDTAVAGWSSSSSKAREVLAKPSGAKASSDANAIDASMSL